MSPKRGRCIRLERQQRQSIPVFEVPFFRANEKEEDRQGHENETHEHQENSYFQEVPLLRRRVVVQATMPRELAGMRMAARTGVIFPEKQSARVMAL